jgi:hypothetical protein
MNLASPGPGLAAQDVGGPDRPLALPGGVADPDFMARFNAKIQEKEIVLKPRGPAGPK